MPPHLLARQEDKDKKELEKVEEIRGSPLSVGNLEEIVDDNHCIVSSTNGPEYYVSIMSFVDRDQLEPNCTVLLHNKVRWQCRCGQRGLIGDGAEACHGSRCVPPSGHLTCFLLVVWLLVAADGCGWHLEG